MVNAFIWIGEHIDDDDQACGLISIIGNAAPEEHCQSEADTVREEIDNGGLLESLFGDDFPRESGVYLVNCHPWCERDYWGEWDGGLELDGDVVRWQDTEAAREAFEKVFRPVEDQMRAWLGGERPVGYEGVAFFEDVEAWALARQSIVPPKKEKS
jgi:hypothetical protein